MFTFEDIRNIAIQIEENGEETYRQVSSESQDETVKEIFSWLADEERRHANWFRNLDTGVTELDEEAQELAAMGKNLLRDMVKDQTFSLSKETLLAAESLEAMLLQSQEFEEDTVLFYDFLLTLLSDEQTAEQLEKIIAEEKKHAIELGKLAASVHQEAV